MDQQKSIIVLDFGGQYAHLIARRVRQCGVYSEIKSAETSAEELKNAAGIILSGGPQSVYDEDSPQADPKIFELGIPVLGICYGLQWLTQTLGGTVTSGHTKEYGPADVRFTAESPLFEGIESKECTVWMSHGDEASRLPEGFIQMGTSDACTNAAFFDPTRKFYAVQFHPEVVHSEHGQTMIENFVKQCPASPWSIESYVPVVEQEIRDIVGDRSVFMLVSGGVDSSVAFTLLNKVLGTDRVQGLLVDTGLMRKDEVADIKEAFDALGIDNLQINDASDLFFSRLAGISDPEEKRKIIGDTFLDVKKIASATMELDDTWMLGQGTIYPDTIETGRTKHADQIKTHHNRVDAVEKLIEQGLVIEPLKNLYKDEVRELGEEIGLPHELVWRHPFPGPGLGVRILCSDVMVSSSNHDLHLESSFDGLRMTCLPVKSVGVQGDGRSYRHALALFSNIPSVISDEAWKAATDIPNSSPDINRVLQCTSQTEAAEFSLVEGYITRDRADLLREADAIVDEEMRRAGLETRIWQFPVVLLPCGIDGGQTIVLRPVESQEAMTANAAEIPSDVLEKMTERIMDLDGIDAVLLDLTHKPPGTIEWE